MTITSPFFRFGTYNLLALTAEDVFGESTRYLSQVQTIRSAYHQRRGALAVQELIADTTEEADDLLRKLARDCGMQCEAVPTRGGNPTPATASQAVGTSDIRFHVGQMWTNVDAIPGTLRSYHGGTDLWHGMVTVMLDAGGPTTTKWGSYHAHPFSPRQRLEEASRVLSAFQDDGIEGAIGADWNGPTASKRANGTYYDDIDYTGQSHRKLRYQVTFDAAHPDAPHVADRDAAIYLSKEPGGLHDIAPLLDVPWKATCGHWIDDNGKPDPFGPGRIDSPRATLAVARTARAHTTHDGPLAKKASDHVLVTADFALDDMVHDR